MQNKGVKVGIRDKSQVLDKDGIKRVLKRIAHEIAEQNPETREVAIVGIKSRGAFLAERVAKNLSEITGTEVPVGAIDITLYRDDLTEIAEQPVVHGTEIEFDVTGKTIVLVDDVLFSGRTVRCALDELVDFGRAARIQLAVLVDRGHRELPIRPDYIGKNVPTSTKECVEVRLEEKDGVEEVVVTHEKER